MGNDKKENKVNQSFKTNYDNEKRERTKDLTDDASEYGEFISSTFAWTGLDKQKEVVEDLEEISKKKSKDKK